MAEPAGAGREQLLEERLAPAVVQLEFLYSFGKSAKVLHERVVFLPGTVQVLERAKDGQLITDRAGDEKAHDSREQQRGQPAEVGQAAQQHGPVDAEDGHAEERAADGRHVLGERREQTVSADLLELAQGSGKDLPAEMRVQPINGTLGEANQQSLRGNPREKHGQAQPGKGGDEQARVCILLAQRRVNDGDQADAAGAAGQPGREGQ